MAELEDPRPVPDPPNPFEAELQRAHDDVTAALGTGSAKKRAPLFRVDAAELLGEDLPESPGRARAR